MCTARRAEKARRHMAPGVIISRCYSCKDLRMFHANRLILQVRKLNPREVKAQARVHGVKSSIGAPVWD